MKNTICRQPRVQMHPSMYCDCITSVGSRPTEEIRYRSGPIWRLIRHPDDTRDTLVTATGSHGGT